MSGILLPSLSSLFTLLAADIEHSISNQFAGEGEN